ncbi:MAG: c-type cytochrome, partial [Aquabacterium sp.]|nr:c-type cytochrome [Aquabacterium sp.]
AVTPALADQALAQRKACLSCHGVDKAVLGPSLKDVASKYRGQKGMEAKLAEKILKGGGGVWKMPMGPMPAQSQVSSAEARQLSAWVLSLK